MFVLIKGNWHNYSFIIANVISVVIGLIVFSVLTIFLSSILFTIALSIAATCLVRLPLIIWEMKTKINWEFNITRKTAKTDVVILEAPVLAKNTGHINNPQSFEVITKHDKTFLVFYGIENYAMAKENEIAKIEVELYYDNEEDLFCVKPLKLIGDYSEDEISIKTTYCTT